MFSVIYVTQDQLIRIEVTGLKISILDNEKLADMTICYTAVNNVTLFINNFKHEFHDFDVVSLNIV